MAVGSAGGSAAGATTAAGVVNQERRGRARVIPAPVRRLPGDLMSFLPDVTRGNAHLFTIWPALEYVQGDETEQPGAPA